MFVNFFSSNSSNEKEHFQSLWEEVRLSPAGVRNLSYVTEIVNLMINNSPEKTPFVLTLTLKV